ncbi:c-type cytochrome [Porticoccus sp. W117]|uniref:c-type cytochrome n=1 Tax=Porticoccus sp. W117 TaxID=3054777 RepID=UPI002595BE42|nr:c-type cytochrome [Porticoccus sp. W117]MDM3870513.1 c-type cytochrome [Porticoccus sp. W117]
MKQVLNNTIVAVALSVGFATAPLVQAEGDAAAGKTKSAACAACHAETGNSLSPAFPKIAGLGEKYLFKQLQDIQSGARQVPEMAGQLDAMNEQDLADIAAYFAGNPMQISGAKEKDWPLEELGSAEFLALGEQVFRAGNMETGVPACTGCHSPSGQGNAPAAYPKLGGQFADYLVKQLKAFRSNARTNDGDSRIMRDVAANMSDKEIEAVANYISGLHIGAGE